MSDWPDLSVGITGHRPDKLSGAALAALRERLREVLASLDAGLLRRHGRPGAEVVPAGAPRCRLVSALAEGADRLAVDAAPSHWALAVILPMPREVYRRDFLAAGQETSASADAFDTLLGRAQTITELPLSGPVEPGAGPRRDAQYAKLGRALLRNIDCLVAVWDGRPPKGPGGTASVVAQAVEKGLAVLWVDPSGQRPARRIARFEGGDISHPVVTGLDETALDEMLAQIRQRRTRPS